MATRFGCGDTTLASGEVGGFVATADLTILTTGGVEIAFGVGILTGTGVGTEAIIGLTIFGSGEGIDLVDGVGDGSGSTSTRSIAVISRSSILFCDK